MTINEFKNQIIANDEYEIMELDKDSREALLNEIRSMEAENLALKEALGQDDLDKVLDSLKLCKNLLDALERLKAADELADAVFEETVEDKNYIPNSIFLAAVKYANADKESEG